MKLYTPAEIAQFVVTHDLSHATQPEVIDALKHWDERMTTGDDGASSRLVFLAARDEVRRHSPEAT